MICYIEIKDNGKGYDVNTTGSAGRGNTMVEERIQALNNLLEDQRIITYFPVNNK